MNVNISLGYAEPKGRRPLHHRLIISQFRQGSRAGGIGQSIKVQNTANVALAKLKAQIMTHNVEVDIMDNISTEIVAGTRQNLLEPIDYSVVKVDRSDIIYPDAVQSHPLS